MDAVSGLVASHARPTRSVQGWTRFFKELADGLATTAEPLRDVSSALEALCAIM